MKAKYYTYRNLNCGAKFSTKHKGIVIHRFENAILEDVEFRVSLMGNLRAVMESKRNVHAYVVSDKVPRTFKHRTGEYYPQIKYNPFRGKHFTVDGKPILKASEVLFKEGMLFLVKE